MTRDLTEGNVTKALLLFAYPMILGNLLQQCHCSPDQLMKISACPADDGFRQRGKQKIG